MNTQTDFIEILQEGQKALEDFRNGLEGARKNLENTVRDFLDMTLTRRLQGLDAADADQIRRLCQSHFAKQWHALTSDALIMAGPFPVLAGHMTHLASTGLARMLSQNPERDENERLRQTMKEHLSYSVDGRLVSAMVLEAPLAALRQADDEAWQCLVCQFYAGFTFDEIADHLGLSYQQVRTRIGKAKQFLLEALA